MFNDPYQYQAERQRFFFNHEANVSSNTKRSHTHNLKCQLPEWDCSKSWLTKAQGQRFAACLVAR